MVSIILPTYNRAYILWRAINSVLSQTYSNFELLIVDDHSSDNTYCYKRIYGDTRIIFLTSETVQSVSGARNTGLKNAKGDLIAYLDSDNWVSNNWLETMVYYANLYKDKNIFFPAQNVTVQEVAKNGRIVQIYKQKSGFTKDFDSTDIWSHNFECDPNGMLHRKIVKEHGIMWDTKLKSYEDFDFTLQILNIFGDTVCFINKVLVDYTRSYGTDGLCSQNTYELIIENLKYIQGKYKGNTSWKKYSRIPEKIEEYKCLNNLGYNPLEYIRERFFRDHK